jgi:quercetin dioxygenase-like cupin family protein
VPVRPVPLQQAAGPLLDLVRSAAADLQLWQPAVRFDTGRRHWARVLTTASAELWLLTWLPSQGTDLHDHGGSAAAFAVLSGEVEEVRAAGDGSLTRTVLRAGDATWVAPDAVHDVAHTGTGPAVSLHAYSPRLTAMSFYEASGGALHRTRTVLTDEPELEVAS